MLTTRAAQFEDFLLEDQIDTTQECRLPTHIILQVRQTTLQTQAVQVD